MEKSTFFQVSISPVRKKPVKKSTQPVIEDKESLILGPFKPSLKLEMAGVKVGTCSAKVISVYNPSKSSIKVNFDVCGDAGEVKIDPYEVEFQEGESRDVTVLWLAPPVPVNVRYTINTRSETQKKLPQIFLICHSIGPKVACRKGNLHKKTIMKSEKSINSNLVKKPDTRSALKNLQNTLGPTKAFSLENHAYVEKDSENLPPENPNIIISSPTNDQCRTYTKKRKSSERCSAGSESCRNKLFFSNEEDVLTSTPNKFDSVLHNSLESCSFTTISTIGNNTLEEKYILAQDTQTTDVTDYYKTYLIETKTLNMDLKKNISKSSNDIDKIITDAFNENLNSDLTLRPKNDRCTYTISSSRMAQSLNDVTTLFTSNDHSNRRCSKSTCDLSSGSNFKSCPDDKTGTLRSEADRATFVIPFPKKTKGRKSSNISSSVDRLENSCSTNVNIRPRSFSTSVTYLDSETLPQFNQSDIVNDSKFKKSFSIYSAFFHEPENIPVDEDPFSRKNIEFHTEEWLREREYELLNWLNALMTPPTGWEGVFQLTIESEDIVKMWHIAARAKTLLLPPSKESLANKSLLESGRLNSLRKSAAQLFNSQEVRQVHDWIRAQISKRVFEVKDDVDLGKNQGSKVLIVQMLMRYNLLWLHIGLEAIYKTTINLRAVNDFQGIISFLQKYLFANELVERKVAAKKNYKIKMESFRMEMNAFVIEKILMLIFFLDKAKTRRLIPFDPCLFSPNSPVKVSEEVLDEFISSFMKCTGGMKNNMKRIGYVLLYHQTCLDEYNYSVKNRNDLRDGIRLTRAVEIILKRNDLGKLLRTPAVSRLQKVNNVQVALNALKAEGFSIIGDITAKDIADGHREKTLSLLWQILNRFIKTRYEFSAKKIQVWWKKKSLFVVINRRVRTKAEKKKARAARIIQSAWRGYSCRCWFLTNKDSLKIENELRRQRALLLNKCATLIQTRYREYRRKKQLRDKFLTEKSAALRIQEWYISIKKMKQERNDYVSIRKATLLIQERYRCFMLMKKCRSEFLITLSAIKKIQNWFRAYCSMKNERNNYLTIKRAAVDIQRFYRSWKLTENQRNEFINIKKSALIIQKQFREYKKMKHDRMKYLHMKKMVILLQRSIRNRLLMKKQRTIYLIQKSSAVKIQTWFRACVAMKADRNNYLYMKSITILIQRKFRARAEMEKCRSEYLNKKCACIKIKQWYKSCLIMKQCRQKYLIKKKSAIIIQKQFRGFREMKKCKSEYLKMKSSCVLIQKWYRSCLLGRKDRNNYLVLKNSAVIIQKQFRNYLKMKQCRSQYLNMKSSCNIIQRWCRRCLLVKEERYKYLLIRNSAIIIQNRFRSYLKMKQCRSDYRKVKASCIIIQNWYRACMFSKNCRDTYLLQKNSAIFIQTHFRSYLKMKQCRSDYKNMKASSILLQRWYRGCLLRNKLQKNYLLTKKSAIVIQNYFRCYLKMKQCRSNYENMKSSCIVIQNWYRACLFRNEYRENFLLLKKSAITIQNQFRSFIQMKQCRSDYNKMKSSCILLQRWYRACLLRNKNKNYYLKLKYSAKVIQKHFKSYLIMKQCRLHYQNMRSSCIRIQNWYRACLLRKQERNYYLLQRSSTIVIQTSFRSYLKMKQCRSNYQNMKSSAIRIQSWYRACLLMKKDREIYLHQKNSAIIIQNKFRSFLKMKQCMSDYQDMKSSCILIQNWYRACLFRKRNREIYLLQKKSAIIIQNKFRSFIKTKQCRSNYLNIRSSCILLQRWYRACLIRNQAQKNYLLQKSSAIVIQTYFRNYLKMKQCRSTYQNMKSSCIIIQNWYRACLLRKEARENYLLKKESAIIIQNKFRSFLKMKECRSTYLKIQYSCILLQRWYRACLIRNEVQKNYLLQKSSAIIIQTYFRNYLKMKHCRSNYQNMKSSAVRIQSWYRACLLRKRDREIYLLQKKSAIIIQNKFRNFLKMKQCRSNYLNAKSSCILIQNWYRACLLRNRDRNNYLLMKKSVIIIQNKLRSFLVMKQCRSSYKIKKSSCILIQRWYRACLLRKDDRMRYMIMKNSAVVIQKKIRSYLLMKHFRSDYQKKKTASILIQRWYRACLLRNEDRNKFLLLRHSAIIIQNHFRSYLEMKQCRQFYLHEKSKYSYLLMVSSVIRIQQWYRACQKMKIERNNYLKLRESTVKIQKYFREKLFLRKKEEELKSKQCYAAKMIQSLWRGYVVRKKYKQILMARREKNKQNEIKHLPNTLRHHFEISLISLKNTRGSLTEKLELLRMFFRLTSYSQELSFELSVSREFHMMLWNSLRVANRAPAYFEVCVAGLNIVMNLARANATGLFKIMIKNNYLEILFDLMSKYITVKPLLFCKAATIIWLLIKQPTIALALVKNDEAMKRINRFRILCSQSKSTVTNKIKQRQQQALPLSRIDGAYNSKRNHNEFQQGLFAIETIFNDLSKYLNILNLN